MKEKGKISVNISSSVPVTNENNVSKLTISAPGYESLDVIPYKGDGTAKDNLGVIKLTPIDKALEQDKIKASQLSKEQIKGLYKDKKNTDFFTQERIINQVNSLKTSIIPTVLTMVAGFGITKATELSGDKLSDAINNKSICPSPIQLDIIIANKNKLVKQLNNSLKVIDSSTKSLGISGGLIEALNLAYKVLKNLPIPSSTGVPGVPGLPINVILNVQDNKDKLDKLIEKLTKTSTNTLPIVVLLRQVLTQVIDLLNILDQLIQKCYPDANQEQISMDLTSLTNEQSNQSSPIVTNVNGFEMRVESENTEKSLKRRRAIAKNKQGVIILKGNWSFSSIDQILIDELVFYIQQNNLKAD